MEPSSVEDGNRETAGIVFGERMSFNGAVLS